MRPAIRQSSARSLPPSAAWVLLLPWLFAGCGYIHFGRLQTGEAEASALREGAELRLEKKILQQELAIARKENLALRTSLEERQTAPSRSEPASALAAAMKELAALRASFSQLNKELLAHKEARAHAEQRLSQLETQLKNASQEPKPSPAKTTALSALRESSASGASAIEFSTLGNILPGGTRRAPASREGSPVPDTANAGENTTMQNPGSPSKKIL